MAQDNLAAANSKFGLNLFKIIRKNLRGKNAFFSPLSISSALSMTQIGARGTTATEMAQVLGWQSDQGEQIHQQFKDYVSALKHPSDEFQLSTANRIYLEETFTIQEQFRKQTQDWYLAEPVQANFVQQPDRVALEINSWVSEQTQNKIKDLFGPGTLDNTTRMVIVNAIYFKGQWDKQFAAEKTSSQPFKLSPGETVDVPTMASKEVYGSFKDTDLKLTAVELPYKGHNLGMVIIIPDEDFGLDELVESLTPDKLQHVLAGVASSSCEKLELYLPKFEISSSFMLKEALSSLGMPAAFSLADADFTGMTGRRDLCISEAVHKAFVQVNEEGTEAAAATGIVMMLRCMPKPVPVLRVDHPFLFAIVDHRFNDTILFLGQIDNPKA